MHIVPIGAIGIIPRDKRFFLLNVDCWQKLRKPSHKGMTISKEIADRALQLYNEGLADKDIATELHISHSSVYNIRKKLNVPPQRPKTLAPAKERIKHNVSTKALRLVVRPETLKMQTLRLTRLVEAYIKVSDDQNWDPLPLRMLLDWSWMVDGNTLYYASRPLTIEADPDYTYTIRVHDKNSKTHGSFFVVQTMQHILILSNAKRIAEEDIFRAKQNLAMKDLPFTYLKIQQPLGE
jgi:hypothetical protein